MTPKDFSARLLRQAARLEKERRGGETDLRRACSATYYALFHFIVGEATDLMLARHAIARPYLRRCFAHGQMKNMADTFRSTTAIARDTIQSAPRSKAAPNLQVGAGSTLTPGSKVALAQPSGPTPATVVPIAVPAKLQEVAKTFVQAYQMRHDADYNLAVRISATDAEALRRRVMAAIASWTKIRNAQATKLFLVGCLVRRPGGM